MIPMIVTTTASSTSEKPRLLRSDTVPPWKLTSRGAAHDRALHRLLAQIDRTTVPYCFVMGSSKACAIPLVTILQRDLRAPERSPRAPDGGAPSRYRQCYPFGCSVLGSLWPVGVRWCRRFNARR